MKTLTRQEAIDRGYYHITFPIHVQNEVHMIRSIERCLSAVDAVWIAVSNTMVEAARKFKDVKTCYSKDTS